MGFCAVIGAKGQVLSLDAEYLLWDIHRCVSGTIMLFHQMSLPHSTSSFCVTRHLLYSWIFCILPMALINAFILLNRMNSSQWFVCTTSKVKQSVDSDSINGSAGPCVYCDTYLRTHQLLDSGILHPVHWVRGQVTCSLCSVYLLYITWHTSFLFTKPTHGDRALPVTALCAPTARFWQFQHQSSSHSRRSNYPQAGQVRCPTRG